MASTSVANATTAMMTMPALAPLDILADDLCNGVDAEVAEVDDLVDAGLVILKGGLNTVSDDRLAMLLGPSLCGANASIQVSV